MTLSDALLIAEACAVMVTAFVAAIILDRGLPNTLTRLAVALVRTSQRIARWLHGASRRMENRRAALALAQEREAAEVIR